MMNLQLERPVAEKGRALNDDASIMNEKVHKLLQESVGSGRIGNLKVDPQYLVFEPQSCKLLEVPILYLTNEFTSWIELSFCHNSSM